jgi:hypothetical protein
MVGAAVDLQLNKEIAPLCSYVESTPGSPSMSGTVVGYFGKVANALYGGTHARLHGLHPQGKGPCLSAGLIFKLMIVH